MGERGCIDGDKWCFGCCGSFGEEVYRLVDVAVWSLTVVCVMLEIEDGVSVVSLLKVYGTVMRLLSSGGP